MNAKSALPLVSVIMGVYNCADTLEIAVESIMKQTYKNWEFIICDDCSTDDTYRILQQYAMKDKRIIALHNENNHRLAYSLNRCLEFSRGEFVARMDGDDESLPTRLEKQVEFLITHPKIDCVGTSVILFDGIRDVGIRVASRPNVNIMKYGGVPFLHPTIMMRKKSYDVLGGYTVSELTKRSQDYDMWFRFYKAGMHGYNILEALYRYHESTEDYEKRTWRTGLNATKIALQGFKKLNFPKKFYFFAFKPLLSALLPVKLVEFYHKKKLLDLKKGEELR